MNKKEFIFATKTDGNYRVYDLSSGSYKAFSPDYFTTKLISSLGDVPTGSKTENTCVITFSPWFDLDLLHRAIDCFRLNDKLMTTLRTGEISKSEMGPILLFKVDEMSTFYLFDGENVVEYTTEHIPYLINREVHVIKNTKTFWEKETVALPTSSKMVTHSQDSKFAIFCFSKPYQRISPPLEANAHMVLDISKIQALGTLAANTELVLGSTSCIEHAVKMIAGFNLAKDHPQQNFMYAFCCFIAAFKQTEAKAETSLKHIAIMATLLSGCSFEESESMVRSIMETQTTFTVIKDTCKRARKG